MIAGTHIAFVMTLYLGGQRYSNIPPIYRVGPWRPSPHRCTSGAFYLCPADRRRAAPGDLTEARIGILVRPCFISHYCPGGCQECPSKFKRLTNGVVGWVIAKRKRSSSVTAMIRRNIVIACSGFRNVYGERQLGRCTAIHREAEC
jgi:hypothetical protein